MNAVDFKCLDPTIFPVTYASTFFLAAVAVFSDLNMDGCCDDHCVPLFVLSLLGSRDSVSLCVVLQKKKFDLFMILLHFRCKHLFKARHLFLHLCCL